MKKFLAIVLAVCMIAALSVCVMAADTKITADEVSAKAGETVTVPVNIEGNTGFASSKITVTYDADSLEVVSVAPGLFKGEVNSGVAGKVIANHASSTDVTGDGALITITFKVKDSAAAGDYSVSVTVNKMNSASKEAVNPTATAGKVTVEAAEAPACEHTNTKVEGAKEATCTEAGSTGKTVCADCGETVKDAEEIAAKGHTEEKVAAVEATCAAEGKTEGTKCSVCGEVIKAQETVAKTTDHKYDDGKVTKEATTEAEGEKTYTCTVCGETKVEPIDKLTKEEETTDPDKKEEETTDPDKKEEETTDPDKKDEETTDPDKKDEETTDPDKKDETTTDKKDDTAADNKVTPSTSDNGTMIMAICLVLLAASGSAIAVLNKKKNSVK